MLNSRTEYGRSSISSLASDNPRSLCYIKQPHISLLGLRSPIATEISLSFAQLKVQFNNYTEPPYFLRLYIISSCLLILTEVIMDTHVFYVLEREKNNIGIFSARRGMFNLNLFRNSLLTDKPEKSVRFKYPVCRRVSLRYVVNWTFYVHEVKRFH